MYTDDFSSDKLIVPEPKEVVNTDEHITDFTFLSKLSKKDSVLDFDYDFFGFCLD